MEKYKKKPPFCSIMDTYLDNQRRLDTIPALPLMLPPPPPPASTSTSSAAKHPLFGPIPPHLLHKYLSHSPTLSISTYNSPPLHSSPSHPPPISIHTNPHPSSCSANQASPTPHPSSPFTQIYIATIDDVPSQPHPSFKKDNTVTLNTYNDRIRITIDDVDTPFCHLLTEDYDFFLKQDDDDPFSLEEISASSFYQSLGEGKVLSTSDLKGEKVSDNPVSRRRKSDAVHFGSHDYNTRCKAKKCF